MGEPQIPAARPARGFKEQLVKVGRMFWWAHSLYALALGIFVVVFARKGFAQARWLTIALAIAFLLVLLLFRLFGSGAERTLDRTRDKLRFYVMTYVLKNLYQGMLFFLLPFYWRSASYGTVNQWFVVVLALCALLSTLDLIFDHVLMRWKLAASLFYFLTLFACLNLVIPALFPNLRSLVTLVAAAVVSSLAFWLMHIRAREVVRRPLIAAVLVLWTFGSAVGAYFGRAAVPPVAMYVSHGAVGPTLLDDGRLAIEATALHESLTAELHALTDVVVPGGKGDRLVHVWVHERREVQRSTDVDPQAHGPTGTIRLRSALRAGARPEDPTGHWRVDVVTQDGQLVGRVAFEVIK